MSELRTNRIVPRDGLPSGASGGVIQVVTAENTVARSNTSHSITDGTWQFTGTTATITPTRSDSKILITFDQSFFWQTNAGGAQGVGIRIYRGSTAITTTNGFPGLYINSGDASNNRVHSYIHGQKLDSPATTSAVTYNLYGRFWTDDWTSLQYQYGNTESPSTITLMEISG